nr:PfkB family carbohydrate kinase [Elusimicrobiales bacterium]
VLEQLRRFRVDTSLVRIRPGLKNPVSLIVVNTKTGARTIIWNSQGLAGQRLKLSAAEHAAVMRAKCLHFDGHLMPDSIALASEAKKRGVLVSYDCGSAKPGWESLARNTDFFIASHRFARDLGLSPAETVAKLKKRFGFSIAVTCGEKGVYYFCEKTGAARLLRQRRYKSVDTTGCGDVFHGFFLAALLKGKSFQQALVFAQKAAGMKSLRPGGRAGIPELKA